MVDIEPGQLSQLGNSREALAGLILVGGEDTGGCLYGGVLPLSLSAELCRHPVSDQSGTSSSWQRLPSDGLTNNNQYEAPDRPDRLGWLGFTLMMELALTL